tara:strand:- start:820 stop:1221 length:402 start_codon:yes stop_codon:yes gene_type:complete
MQSSLEKQLYGDFDRTSGSSLVTDEVRARRVLAAACSCAFFLTHLPSFFTSPCTTTQLRFERDAARSEVSELRAQNEALQAELKTSSDASAALETNISSLYLTAKAELGRKDRVIAELRAELSKATSSRGGRR